MSNLLFKLNLLVAALSLSTFTIADERTQLPIMVVNAKQKSNFDEAPNVTHLDEADLQRSGQRELSQVLRAGPRLA